MYRRELISDFLPLTRRGPLGKSRFGLLEGFGSAVFAFFVFGSAAASATASGSASLSSSFLRFDAALEATAGVASLDARPLGTVSVLAVASTGGNAPG